jgi:hypothetical protein
VAPGTTRNQCSCGLRQSEKEGETGEEPEVPNGNMAERIQRVLEQKREIPDRKEREADEEGAA